MMRSRREIVDWLDSTLAYVGEDSSCNGLQVEGAERVSRIGLAVDASLESFSMAGRKTCQLLLVHHGLFWRDKLPARVNRAWRARLKECFDSDLNLYASHLPLDCHPVYGNNAEIARGMGLKGVRRGLEYRGVKIGCIGNKNTTIKTMASDYGKFLGSKVRVFDFGPERVRRIGVCSGGGGFAAGSGGIDALLTGEFNHGNYHYAKEAGVSVLAGGHYATEALGVKALGRALEKKFGVETVFLDAPTGL
jgi:dinuclear metal center YbgI/SA1388 family protein